MASERAVIGAVSAAIAEADQAEPEQLGLFDAPLTSEGQAAAAMRGRGPGRPAGSRNRRTERTIKFLLSRHRDPREVLLEIAEANVFDLAALLGCKPFEAMQEKRLAAIGVLPYVAARITPEQVNDNRQVMHLTINAGAPGGAVAGAGATARVLDAIEYQAIEPEPESAP